MKTESLNHKETESLRIDIPKTQTPTEAQYMDKMKGHVYQKEEI